MKTHPRHKKPQSVMADAKTVVALRTAEGIDASASPGKTVAAKVK